MTFFQQLAALNLVGTLKVTIKMDGGKQLVSVVLDNEKCGDDAKVAIPPLLLKGDAKELDAGFFDRISRPVRQSSELQVNMEAYLKGLENAKAQSAMSKKAEEDAKKEKETKKKAFEEAMKKVDELIKAKRFGEAMARLPSATEYPDMVSAIDAKRRELNKSKTFQPSLLDMEVEEKSGELPENLPGLEETSTESEENDTEEVEEY